MTYPGLLRAPIQLESPRTGNVKPPFPTLRRKEGNRYSRTTDSDFTIIQDFAEQLRLTSQAGVKVAGLLLEDFLRFFGERVVIEMHNMHDTLCYRGPV